MRMKKEFILAGLVAATLTIGACNDKVFRPEPQLRVMAQGTETGGVACGDSAPTCNGTCTWPQTCQSMGGNPAMCQCGMSSSCNGTYFNYPNPPYQTNCADFGKVCCVTYDDNGEPNSMGCVSPKACDPCENTPAPSCGGKCGEHEGCQVKYSSDDDGVPVPESCNCRFVSYCQGTKMILSGGESADCAKQGKTCCVNARGSATCCDVEN
jgi:hypothetical protein